jgi:TonB family protein
MSNRTITWAIALMLAIPGVAHASDTAKPLQPSGPWAVDPGDADCTLSHDYKADAFTATLAFRAGWGGLIDKVLLETPASGDDTLHFEKVELHVGDAAATVIADSNSGIVGATRVTTVTLPDPFGPSAKPGDARLPDPPIARTISVRVGEKPPLTFPMPGAAAAFAALAKCEDALMDRLGVFPYERRHYARDDASPPAIAFAKGNPAQWITWEDYPKVSAGMEGVSTIFWVIGTDGRVHDCRVLVSSGHPELDDAACAALTKRAHYTPATDKEGNPIALHDSRRINWRVPH